MKSQAEHYDEYYEDVEKSPPFTEEMGGQRNKKKEFLLDLFRTEKAKKILDIGCGPGFDSSYFSKKGFVVHACDISNKAIEYAKKHNQGPKYFVCNFEEKHVKEKYDAIYAFEVIEHVLDFDAFLTNVRKSLKEGGIFILTTPNVLAPRNRIKLLFGKPNFFKDKYHLHFFSPGMLKEYIERNGMKTIKAVGSGKISFLGANFGGSLTMIARNERGDKK